MLLQGRLVRARTLRLPEPPGARQGVTGLGRRLRLLIIGDSSAAGVGAPHQDQALLGQVVSRLEHEYRVEWHLMGKTGATTASTLAGLRNLPPTQYDVAVTALGVNDVTSGVRRAAWLRQQAELRVMLRRKFQVSHIVTSGLPPIHGFPALPQPLRWCLGARASHFNRDLEGDVERDGRAYFVDLRFFRDASGMAPDGYHPGPDIYAAWGGRVADLILDNFR